MIDRWRGSLDVLLVFVSDFSATKIELIALLGRSIHRSRYLILRGFRTYVEPGYRYQNERAPR